MNNLEENLQKSSTLINRYSYDQLLKWVVDEQWAAYVNLIVLLALTVALVYIVHFVAWRLCRVLLTRFSGKGRRTFFRYLKNRRFGHYVALIAPVSLVKGAIPIVFDNFPLFIKPFNALLSIDRKCVV